MRDSELVLEFRSMFFLFVSLYGFLGYRESRVMIGFRIIRGVFKIMVVGVWIYWMSFVY